ncbi:MAG: DUF2087 domain-containing protein [Oscillospiraceae bacterium]|jgi:hypothetical protein|nr:DUF2087 domain-containing protein [Oscillospiraceae bacterium]
MPRDFGREIDELKRQIDELARLFAGKQPEPKEKPEYAGEVKKMEKMHPDPAIMSILDRLEDTCGESGDTGRITYLGVFTSGGRQSNWVQNGVSADELLKLIEDNTAEKVLRCIGSSDRLNILLALLKQPMTVAALVERHGYNTTGQVYHHLKPLLAADLITEDKNAAKGTYFVNPHRVQGIIMLLAGIHDLVDVRYTKGDWSAEIHSGAKMVDERYMTTAEEEERIIKTYFASLEPLTLKKFPLKEKRKLVILRVIAGQFECKKRYSEKEINQILKGICEDYVTVRRYLIEYGFMERTRDCSEYWRSDEI